MLPTTTLARCGVRVVGGVRAPSPFVIRRALSAATLDAHDQVSDAKKPMDEQINPSFFKASRLCNAQIVQRDYNRRFLHFRWSNIISVSRRLTMSTKELACILDKGVQVVENKLVEEHKGRQSDEEKRNLVRGILSAMKPVNKVSKKKGEFCIEYLRRTFSGFILDFSNSTRKRQIRDHRGLARAALGASNADKRRHSLLARRV